MQVSEAGLNLIKRFESCKLQAYPDVRGIPTIGWGHTWNVALGMTCTQEQADAWLLSDLATAEREVSQSVSVPLTQLQFDALVAFVYNVGGGQKGFGGSTMLRLIEQQHFIAASREFLKWNKVEVNGKLVPSVGLSNRRNAEHDLFLEGMPA